MENDRFGIDENNLTEEQKAMLDRDSLHDEEETRRIEERHDATYSPFISFLSRLGIQLTVESFALRSLHGELFFAFKLGDPTGKVSEIINILDEDHVNWGDFKISKEASQEDKQRFILRVINAIAQEDLYDELFVKPNQKE